MIITLRGKLVLSFFGWFNYGGPVRAHWMFFVRAFSPLTHGKRLYEQSVRNLK